MTRQQISDQIVGMAALVFAFALVVVLVYLFVDPLR